MTARVRAPELRGRFVLLDFWTFCCVNCLHVLDELRPVEERARRLPRAQQDWGVPIRITAGAGGVLELPLGDSSAV